MKRVAARPTQLRQLSGGAPRSSDLPQGPCSNEDDPVVLTPGGTVEEVRTIGHGGHETSASEIVLITPVLVTIPIECPSGAKKHTVALSEPFRAIASNWSRARRYTCRVPARTPTNATRLPSGETATVRFDVNNSTPVGSVISSRLTGNESEVLLPIRFHKTNAATPSASAATAHGTTRVHAGRICAAGSGSSDDGAFSASAISSRASAT